MAVGQVRRARLILLLDEGASSGAIMNELIAMRFAFHRHIGKPALRATDLGAEIGLRRLGRSVRLTGRSGQCRATRQQRACECGENRQADTVCFIEEILRSGQRDREIG